VFEYIHCNKYQNFNKFQDQLDATANNPELKDSVKQVENEFKDETTTNKDRLV
jgi:hypothetical protein